MRYKDFLENKTEPNKPLQEDDGGGATSAGDIGTVVGYLGASPAKKSGKSKKPTVIRRPKI